MVTELEESMPLALQPIMDTILNKLSNSHPLPHTSSHLGTKILYSESYEQ